MHSYAKGINRHPAAGIVTHVNINVQVGILNVMEESGEARLEDIPLF